MKRKRPYWYRMWVGECPVCGRRKSYRERVYGKRPKKAITRMRYLSHAETYDHCEG